MHSTAQHSTAQHSTAQHSTAQRSVKVSIILPFYNVEKYVRQCLDSIINQTLQEIEIICINDCTPDRSFDIVKEYASKDSRFVLIEHETNQGQGIARNNGIAIATGEYIGFVDPDDWIEPDMFQTMYDTVKKYDADMVETLFTSHYQFPDRTDIKPFKTPLELPQDGVFDWHFNHNFPFMVFLGVWNKLIKADFIRKNDLLFDIGTYAEDQIFTIKSRLLASKIVFCPQSLYNYRLRNDSACCVNLPAKKSFIRISQAKNVKELLLKYNYYETLYQEYWQYIIPRLAATSQILQAEIRNEYDRLALDFIPSEHHSNYRRLQSGYKNFGERMFSIKNFQNEYGKYKFLTIFGIRIKLKRKL